MDTVVKGDFLSSASSLFPFSLRAFRAMQRRLKRAEKLKLPISKLRVKNEQQLELDKLRYDVKYDVNYVLHVEEETDDRHNL
jgi:hypothetical protein